MSYSLGTVYGPTGLQGSQGSTGTKDSIQYISATSMNCTSIALDKCTIGSLTSVGAATFGGTLSGPTGSFTSLVCSTYQGSISGSTASFATFTCSGNATFNQTVSGPTGIFTSLASSGQGTFGNIVSSGIADNQFSVLGNVDTSGSYANNATLGMSIGWNQGGNREISLMNIDTSGGGGIVLRQRTGTSTSNTLMSISTSGDVSLLGSIGGATGTFSSLTIGGNPFPAEMFRNRILNGGMRIDQRNSGASVANVAGQVYTVDRMYLNGSVSNKMSAQQSTTTPSGFDYSLCITSSSAYTCTTNDYFYLAQTIEGYHLADFQWGTSYAQNATLSFWARSSIAGTYGIRFSNGAGDRCYTGTYTITTANTFQYVTITVPGDTSGTYAADTSSGIVIAFSMGAGSAYNATSASTSWSSSNYIQTSSCTNLVGTNTATFYITGLQFEKGHTATAFENRYYAKEFELCQRYYQILPYYATAAVFNTTIAYCTCTLPTPMRSSPTMSFGSGTYTVWKGSTSVTSTTTPTTYNTTSSSVQFTITGLSASTTAGFSGYLSSGPTIAVISEL